MVTSSFNRCAELDSSFAGRVHERAAKTYEINIITALKFTKSFTNFSPKQQKSFHILTFLVDTSKRDLTRFGRLEIYCGMLVAGKRFSYYKTFITRQIPLYYFAYGSNMNWPQMQRRCPSAQFVCVARLANYEFGITRHSRLRNCGTAKCFSGARERGLRHRLRCQ